MLQIVGLLGCAYLFVKAMELFGRADRYRPTARGRNWRDLSPEEKAAWKWEARGMGTTSAAAVVALIAAMIFALWLIVAGAELQQSVSSITGSYTG